MPTRRSPCGPKTFQTPSALTIGSRVRSTRSPGQSATGGTVSSEEANRPTLGVDVDAERRRAAAQPRHRLHVAAERDQPARPRVGAQVADRDGEPRRCVRGAWRRVRARGASWPCRSAAGRARCGCRGRSSLARSSKERPRPPRRPASRSPRSCPRSGPPAGRCGRRSSARPAAAATASASAAAPAPPCSNASLTSAAYAPCSRAIRRTSSTSSSVSSGKRLTATTAWSPNSRTIPRWRARFAPPSSRSPPPWCLSAFAVATSTTAFGRSPPARQTMLKNFSIPMSEPKPLSVTTKSPSLSASRSATSELLPCAMFANGPQWISAGCPSSVWTRFGLIVSFRSTVIAPPARSISAVTGSPSNVEPIVIAPSRSRRSSRSRATATIAITSEAAVMSKPVWRT